MRFVCVPGWVPVQVTGRPVVEFSFGDAVVAPWSTVDESGATRPSGEVDLFDWDGHRAFTLRASTAAIDLSAATLHVRTSPPPDAALSPASVRRWRRWR